ncbi:hypothetical protein K431DRAFT_221934 [Polychaeton citri CBS 116435]|uniref:Uncharacterized protein n=1 Tax=Polychaeton citri CBS 116435 TaxID=1314669 RepID=A0A9P4QAM1_9PEZI|nr:hypothetical protein K431DRAFT_221934 [Polychaeton citri CBS 116435]
MRSATISIAALAALCYAQDGTTEAAVVATPDALPLSDLRDVDIPTYTAPEGLWSYDVPYTPSTAIASASASQSQDPLSTFPAQTDAPINSAGEDDSDAPAKRAIPFGQPLERRKACDPQPTVPNYYSVNVDSYSAFKADPTISSVASSATNPSGYFSNFKNLPGASNAYAYLGYTLVKSGQYDVDFCASKCNAKSGCLAFNIWFERDPVVDPGTGCTNPDAFANVKCSFWGSGLDSKTANNYGQWRSQFQVGVAGSNGYTSYKLGGPVDDYTNPPQYFNTSVMNSPLRDCAGTWTYMGYKLFQSGPYDARLCAAACDAQTDYDKKHPPSDGSTVPLCGAFGSYVLTLTNSTGSYVQGQMCTLYTSNWDKQYAVNTVSYDDSIGAKYTYTYSYFYSKPENQPTCSSS